MTFFGKRRESGGSDVEKASADPSEGQGRMDPKVLDPNTGETEGLSQEQEEVLHRKLKGRHMQMIAIGGSIGTGLFVGSGSALQSGGPASLVIDFIIIGIMLFFTVHALGELAVMYPVAGAFYTYSCRFIDPAWGYAMGMNYAFNWLVVLPLELTAAAVIGFIITAIIINCGGVPTDNRGYIGGRYWHTPGAFRNGFKGFCSVFVTAGFAFAGTELVGLAAAEADNPRKSLPKATKQVFWRISLFYIVSLTLVGLIVPSDDSRLLNASGGNTAASPFVIAFQLANIAVLPSIFNVVITLAVISVANSCTYGSTRTLHALAERHMLPSWFGYVDSHGRPVFSLIIALLFGCLAFINEAAAGEEIFNWLLALSGLSQFFTWASINLAHIRFRHAWKLQGNSLDEIPFRAAGGIIGSYMGFGLNCLVLVAQFYIAISPLGSPMSAKNFFQNYLAAFIILLFYLGYKFWKRDWSWYIKLEDIDLVTGRRELNLGETLRKEREERAGWPTWKKAWHWFC
ncbi:hypothetical protein AOL_s00170g65 [Orbilia oligospora ATCC 24927]|uniref:Amino acid permease/ SLC12A domain-containing protein n=1 Tax=Arthrobotrys oligospora (strain ATCC 24927 / CBS 115.81 / DSM 1491) TaxID=756982 RepID=G1XN99_ARTOA|nr:hypothetical protein AOL_s00170g65 [Orbilia oligospora ATCC 24927]EGX45358.1 hypothetical protein AOL_s00170g65 [Orbilia oligospora ATCC 24927]